MCSKVCSLILVDAGEQLRFSSLRTSHTMCTNIHFAMNSVEASLTVEERKQRLKEAELRAKFVQQLVLSTLLGDK